MNELKSHLDNSNDELRAAINEGESNGYFNNKSGKVFKGELLVVQNVIQKHLVNIEKGIYG